MIIGKIGRKKGGMIEEETKDYYFEVFRQLDEKKKGYIRRSKEVERDTIRLPPVDEDLLSEPEAKEVDKTVIQEVTQHHQCYKRYRKGSTRKKKLNEKKQHEIKQKYKKFYQMHKTKMTRA
eukprot:4201355-Amphidinium_carterae.7